MPLMRRGRLLLRRDEYSPGMGRGDQIVVRIPAPELDLARITDDPKRGSVSAPVRSDGVTCLHHNTDSIYHLNISDSNGLHLHTVSKSSCCFITRCHDRLDRRPRVEVYRKIQPMNAGVDNIPFGGLDLDKFKLSNLAILCPLNNLKRTALHHQTVGSGQGNISLFDS